MTVSGPTPCVPSERGKPALSTKQIDLVDQLLRDLDLTADELKEETGVDGIAAIRTADQASRVID